MKHIILSCLYHVSIIFLLFNIDLYSHGFGKKTIVHSDIKIYTFKQLCKAVANGKKKYVISFNFQTNTPNIQKIIRIGKSDRRVSVYMKLSCQIGFTNTNNDIVCSLFQEFYCTDTHQWVQAKNLHIGNSVLTRYGPKQLTYVKQVSQGKKIRLYMIEVEDTHLFFVGNDALLTHNMCLPIMLKLGFDIACTAGTAAGTTTGSFFGPLGMAIGAAIGGIAGLLTAHICKNTFPTFKINARTPNNSPIIYENAQNGVTQSSHCIAMPIYHEKQCCGSNQPVKSIKTPGFTALTPKKQQSLNGGCTEIPISDQLSLMQIPKINDNKSKEINDAQAPGQPTEKDGYKPPKNWDGKKAKHPKNGKIGWPDDKGNIWVPTGPGAKAHGGPHWDVQHPNGKTYDNVYPGGTIRIGRR
ncbi:MAG TPA: polymorphic toxin-type HINT domain-containing protein [Candidatus Babeliales bacterium]|jgi:hypothetical protein|nr:polymorphic toxin-type HINT domain-containing protein [Candidatus Babeliales bacterium]